MVVDQRHVYAASLLNLVITLCTIGTEAQYLPRPQKREVELQNVVAEMQVLCHGDSILLRMNTNAPFNGKVYAKDAPASPNCVSEFNSATNMTFRLPLKSCGTLSSESEDGIEYFNTVVVQPHMRLMTNQGKGYHIRCKYQTRERTIANTQFNVSASFLMQDSPRTTTPLLATASMPSCTMKIFRRGRNDVAETVKIGDKLVMVIEIDQQDMYGMRISNCYVRDGMNMAEQQLIDPTGCPIDDAIMPSFEYSNNNTRAAVSFPAHKFPHTSSVYYQCNVSLCINNGNCQPAECRKPTQPPLAPPSASLGALQAAASTSPTQTVVSAPANSTASRRKRYATGSSSSSSLATNQNKPGSLKIGSKPGASWSKLISARSDDMSFDVYSGLNVDDPDSSEDLTSLTTEKGLVLSWPRPTQASDPSRDADQGSSTGSSQALRVVGLGLAAMASVAVIALLGLQLGLVGPSSHSGGGDIQQASPQSCQLSQSSLMQTRRLPRALVIGSSNPVRVSMPPHNGKPTTMGEQQQHCWRFDSHPSGPNS